MAEQINLFDIGKEKLTFSKPLRLIELFAGYGSQALALKYLGIPFEHWRISEWAIKSIQAYKDMHFADDDTKYSDGMTIDELVDWFDCGRISSDYDTPLNHEQLVRIKKRLRLVYDNMMATHNIGSIVSAHASDLGIVDTAHYTYLLTYSFPCQDLSNAGKQAGMSKGSGTRSGLLWEVERLLDECNELPQILLMENVPAVVGSANIDDFRNWILFLESKGYTSSYQILNAKDYGVPQNRERCFMVSWLGDYYYNFPEGWTLEKRLKDVLEPEVDESYYLADATVQKLFRSQIVNVERERESTERSAQADGDRLTGTRGTSCAYLNYRKIDETETEVAKTLCARDYKGFGTGFDTMNGVIEFE